RIDLLEVVVGGGVIEKDFRRRERGQLDHLGCVFLDFGPLLLAKRDVGQLRVGAQKFWLDRDRLLMRMQSVIVFLLFLIDPAQFVPRDGVFGVNRNGFLEFLLGVSPLFLLLAGDTLLILFSRILRRKFGG